MPQTDPLATLPQHVVDDTDSFYDLLEVPYNATTEQIKDAYREKIRLHHPDASDKEYADDMAYALNQAVDVLGSQAERMAYNEMGHKQYHRQRRPTSDTTTQQTTDETEYESSIYELIRMAKINTYTKDPWWKVILRSNGFKLTIGVLLSLAALFGLLLFI